MKEISRTYISIVSAIAMRGRDFYSEVVKSIVSRAKMSKEPN